jgi:surfactin synthase thioesterase subunit
MMTQESWLAHYQLNHQASLRLFCFPYTGGGAIVFRSWREFLPAQIEVCPVEIPGRGTRLMEIPFTQLKPLIEALAPALVPYLNKPFALFGHSMGALIAFEVARKLSQEYGRSPVHLFVSGRGGPHIPERSPIHHLSDSEFIEGLRSLNGTSTEVLDNHELMQLLIPTLRADFTMAETYVFTPGTPLDCPITAFGGLQDPEAKPKDIITWRQYTSDAFSSHMLTGDHFFINTAREPLLQLCCKNLLRTERSCCIKP